MQDFVSGALRAERLEATSVERTYIEALAHRLYVLAWIIEGVAVALGLGMAVALNASGTFSDFLLSGGGFVIVACAELSKIPLATFFVETKSRRAKLVTLAFLLLMSMATFGTIFFSLERGLNSRMRDAQLESEKIFEYQREYERQEKFIKNPVGSVDEARSDLEKRFEATEREFEDANKRIAQERELLGKQDPILPSLQKRIEEREAALRASVDARDGKTRSIEEQLLRDLRILNKQLDDARKNNDGDRYQRIVAEISNKRSQAAREKGRTESEHQRQRMEIEKELKTLRDRRDSFSDNTEATLRARQAKLDQQQEDLRQNYNRDKEIILSERNALRLKEQELRKAAESAQRKQEQLFAAISDSQKALRAIAADSQPHRVASSFAGWWTGKEYEPHTVPEAYVRRVGAIWFGSMALLGAIGGAVIAMISQLLLRKAAAVTSAHPEDLNRAKSRPSAAAKLLVTIARRFSKTRIKTVEVVKTHRQVVAVPVPVSAVSMDRLKEEFSALSGPLSEEPGSAATA